MLSINGLISLIKTKTMKLACIALAVCMLILSCHSKTGLEKEQPFTVTGNWLILYPDHQLRNEKERRIYSEYQDSIVQLFGLKLVQFHPDESFSELDSVHKKGKWTLSKDSTLEVRDGGKGFNRFIAKFESLADDTLQLTEFVPLGGRPIQLVWNLKRIHDDEEAAMLFKPENNQWRIKPSQPETEDELRKRLGAMLNYYSDYFHLIGAESIYFIPSRIALPFKYYQRAIRLESEMDDHFKNMFFNDEQAEMAKNILQSTLTNLEDYFPRRKDFVAEYAAYLELMARKILKIE